MKSYRGFIGLLSVLAISNAQDSNQTDASNQTEVDLSMLGTPTWERLRPGWALTVNDQCLYEFTFQFKHDPTLPMGSPNFEGQCVFKDPVTKGPLLADDDLPYLDPRSFWQEFPDYAWAAMGFQHLSVDWYPCGHQPRGYAKPHYGLSFFRITPEFRAQTMTCELITDELVIVPGEQICGFQQESINGMNFNIIPSHILNRNAVANMPERFQRPELGNGPAPYVGTRSWDQEDIPSTPNQWNDYTPLFMSSYGGDLIMWHAKAPFSWLSGPDNRYTSNSYRYFEPTIDTLPDSYSFHYDAEEEVIRYTIVGKSGLCREDFDKAEAAAGGPPVNPNWDDYFADGGSGGSGGGDGGTGDGEGSGGGDDNKDDANNDENKSASFSRTSPWILLLPGIGGITSLLLWAQL